MNRKVRELKVSFEKTPAFEKSPQRETSKETRQNQKYKIFSTQRLHFNPLTKVQPSKSLTLLSRSLPPMDEKLDHPERRLSYGPERLVKERRKEIDLRNPEKRCVTLKSQKVRRRSQMGWSRLQQTKPLLEFLSRPLTSILLSQVEVSSVKRQLSTPLTQGAQIHFASQYL